MPALRFKSSKSLYRFQHCTINELMMCVTITTRILLWGMPSSHCIATDLSCLQGRPFQHESATDESFVSVFWEYVYVIQQTPKTYITVKKSHLSTPVSATAPYPLPMGKGVAKSFYGEDILLVRSGFTRLSGCCRQTLSYILTSWLSLIPLRIVRHSLEYFLFQMLV